jgi:hypothetical protein
LIETCTNLHIAFANVLVDLLIHSPEDKDAISSDWLGRRSRGVSVGCSLLPTLALRPSLISKNREGKSHGIASCHVSSPPLRCTLHHLFSSLLLLFSSLLLTTLLLTSSSSARSCSCSHLLFLVIIIQSSPTEKLHMSSSSRRITPYNRRPIPHLSHLNPTKAKISSHLSHKPNPTKAQKHVSSSLPTNRRNKSPTSNPISHHGKFTPSKPNPNPTTMHKTCVGWARKETRRRSHDQIWCAHARGRGTRGPDARYGRGGCWRS